MAFTTAVMKNQKTTLLMNTRRKNTLAIQAGQAALAEGDFAAYGETQSTLQDALGRAIEARAEIAGITATPTDAEAPAEGEEAPAP